MPFRRFSVGMYRLHHLWSARSTRRPAGRAKKTNRALQVLPVWLKNQLARVINSSPYPLVLVRVARMEPLLGRASIKGTCEQILGAHGVPRGASLQFAQPGGLHGTFPADHSSRDRVEPPGYRPWSHHEPTRSSALWPLKSQDRSATLSPLPEKDVSLAFKWV